MVTADLKMFRCFIHMKSQLQEKNMVLPIEKFPSLVLTKNTIMSYHLIQFLLYYLLSGHLQEFKNKRKFQTFSFESGCGCFYERWLLTRGSKYSDLTQKLLVCCRRGH